MIYHRQFKNPKNTIEELEGVNPRLVKYWSCRRVALLGRPEHPFRTAIYFTCDVFSPRFLRVPSTDSPETLPHDQNLAVFYKLTWKISGVLPPKKLGSKTCKISVNFGPLQIWSRISLERCNISEIGKTYELGKFLLRLMIKDRWTLVH